VRRKLSRRLSRSNGSDLERGNKGVFEMNRNKKLALAQLGRVIEEFDLNSQITTSVETNEPFIIIETWKELGIIQRELNRAMTPKFFYRNYINYLNIKGDEAFQHMRLQKKPPYIVPEGLHELDDWFEWGFSDEYDTCSNCGRSFCTQPRYYGDIPKFAVLNDEILCHECIRDEFEEEYIESVTNTPRNAIKINIINESRLAELGWKRLPRKYENGMHHDMNDRPSDVFNKLKKRWDVLFEFRPSQFYVEFCAWIRKPSSDDEGL
jgi:hypothetical protein